MHIMYVAVMFNVISNYVLIHHLPYYIQTGDLIGLDLFQRKNKDIMHVHNLFCFKFFITILYIIIQRVTEVNCLVQCLSQGCAIIGICYY